MNEGDDGNYRGSTSIPKLSLYASLVVTAPFLSFLLTGLVGVVVASIGSALGDAFARQLAGQLQIREALIRMSLTLAPPALCGLRWLFAREEVAAYLAAMETQRKEAAQEDERRSRQRKAEWEAEELRLDAERTAYWWLRKCEERRQQWARQLGSEAAVKFDLARTAILARAKLAYPNYDSEDDLLQRGWTEGLITTLEPADIIVRFDFGDMKSACSISLYDSDRVFEEEDSVDFERAVAVWHREQMRLWDEKEVADEAAEVEAERNERRSRQVVIDAAALQETPPSSDRTP